MNRQLIAIKLGGGLITDKTKPFTARPKYIKLFARELGRLRHELPNADFLVGNGGGSFAHFSAHQYGLREGAATPEQHYGVCVTHNGARKLNTMVADELTKQRVAAFGLSPSALFTTDNGIIVSSHLNPIRYLLQHGYVPLLHGDTVCDVTRGTCILSTEDVLAACTQAFRDLYNRVTVIYVMSTDGVLDADGKRISRLGSNDSILVRQSLTHDVTGEIAGKVNSAREAAGYADAVYLISGKITGELQKAIAGGDVGTKIEPSAPA